MGSEEARQAAEKEKPYDAKEKEKEEEDIPRATATCENVEDEGQQSVSPHTSTNLAGRLAGRELSLTETCGFSALQDEGKQSVSPHTSANLAGRFTGRELSLIETCGFSALAPSS